MCHVLAMWRMSFTRSTGRTANIWTFFATNLNFYRNAVCWLNYYIPTLEYGNTHQAKHACAWADFQASTANYSRRPQTPNQPRCSSQRVVWNSNRLISCNYRMACQPGLPWSSIQIDLSPSLYYAPTASTNTYTGILLEVGQLKMNRIGSNKTIFLKCLQTSRSEWLLVYYSLYRIGFTTTSLDLAWPLALSPRRPIVLYRVFRVCETLTSLTPSGSSALREWALWAVRWWCVR